MAGWDNAPLVAVGGPTASGKTAFAVELAKRLGGEVVCADSMQIYQGLDVGTAKATAAEMQAVPHHLMDFLPPEQPFSVAEYVAAAQKAVAGILARGRLPIVAGGTGLYIESLLTGLRFAEEKPDPALRQRLEEEAGRLGPEAMHKRLAAIDPEYAAGVHPNNRGRVLRALESYYATGATPTARRAASKPRAAPYDAQLFCLAPAKRQTLYDRIDRRVDKMLENGLLDEARGVWEHRDAYRTAAQAIGYKELFPFFEGRAALDECAAALKQASRRYAKRQLTWFRRMEGAVWLDPEDPATLETALALIRRRFGL